MTSILIKNGHVIDPANGVDGELDILIVDGKIAEIGSSLKAKAEETIDAKGLTITPGLIDMQVHFREPGREDRETLETGSMAALAGGVTSVVTMPNLSPVADNQSVIEFIIKRARELDLINIFPSGSITKAQEGSRLAEIMEMKNSGAIAITDDGVDVQDEGILRRAMEYAKTCDILLMSHCETNSLTEGGVMHEGWVSTQLGLPATPAISEELAVEKNVALAKLTGARFHALHNSAAGAVDTLRRARKAGYTNITGEVSVQHFALTDEECMGYNTNAKMYPPLRSDDHVKAIIAAIKDDTITALTTDHAPHIEPDKLAPFVDAAFGSTGLETSFAVMNTYLVEAGHIALAKGIEKMTKGPADILRLNKGALSKGSLAKGADADIAIFDCKKKWTVDAYKNSFSKGKNCVFDGKELTGKAIYTIVGGRIKYREGEIIR